MSARFFKILAVVLGIHLVVLSVVWVGFSAPFPRPPATFTYQGSLPAEDTNSPEGQAWPKSDSSKQITLDRFDASYFDHWIELRDPAKTFSYDHLGF
jgi:hypothetical protein